jgi:hypothetical protein
MIVYSDVARLIQIAWEFGPNGNINLEQLKRKLSLHNHDLLKARFRKTWHVYSGKDAGKGTLKPPFPYNPKLRL